MSVNTCLKCFGKLGKCQLLLLYCTLNGHETLQMSNRWITYELKNLSFENQAAYIKLATLVTGEYLTHQP